MRVEPFERRQVEPRGDRGAFFGVGDEVDAVAVADPVERQAVGEIAHAELALEHGLVRRARQALVEAAQRLARIGRGALGGGQGIAIDAEADRVGPVAFAAARMAPAVDPAGERADHRAHLLADRRIAEALLAHLRRPCRR